MHNKLNLQGQRFERLLAIKEMPRIKKDGRVIWLCRCDCGNLTEVRTGDLMSTNTKSCGCLNIERFKENRCLSAVFKLKHGDSLPPKNRLYKVWTAMRQRCSNPKAAGYKYYGAKRIIVCDEWINDYLLFKNWALANGYKQGLTIDRIDSNGNYEPSNCQWITRIENVRKASRERGLHK